MRTRSDTNIIIGTCHNQIPFICATFCHIVAKFTRFLTRFEAENLNKFDPEIWKPPPTDFAVIIDHIIQWITWWQMNVSKWNGNDSQHDYTNNAKHFFRCLIYFKFWALLIWIKICYNYGYMRLCTLNHSFSRSWSWFFFLFCSFPAYALLAVLCFISYI